MCILYSIEQAGFLANRSCSDQVLAFTTHIERGFQERKKNYRCVCSPNCSL